MARSTFFLFVLFAVLSLLEPLETTRAAITWSGNLDPADPNTWTTSVDGYVGRFADGSLMIDGGDDISISHGYIAYNPGVIGQVTVSGVGSTWTIEGLNDGLYVGRKGSGTLVMADGGAVTVNWITYVGYDESSTGKIAFGLGGGTLTTQTLYSSPAQLTGTGTINTRSLVSDVDLTFDSIASLTRTLHFDSEPDQDITVNLDMSGSGVLPALGAGFEGSGTLVIRDGMTVQSSDGVVGFKSGSTGAATVSGAGSTWINSDQLQIGHYGSGTLAIIDGGTVNSNFCEIGYGADSSGEVTVSGANSTWTNSSDLAVGFYTSGTLTITGGGTVTSQTGTIGSVSGSIGGVMVSGVGSTWTISSVLTVGNDGTAMLAITHGGTVSNSEGCIGYFPGPTHEVTVSGAGSKWVNSDSLRVGHYGNGRLAITAGGAVSSSYGYIGSEFSSTGEVMVSGSGSTWTNSANLYVGDSGTGTLAITDGGVVVATDVSINDSSLLAIEVNNGSRLTLDSGNGTIDNDGTVRIMAGAGPAANSVYTPVLAGTWTGSGAYEALGGTWDENAHEFTVSDVEVETSGTTVSIKLDDVQRVRIDDVTTDWSVGTSFLAKTGAPLLDFKAMAISGTVLDDLENWLEHGRVVRGAWEFAAGGGYSPGEPAYLSFDVVAGDSRERLAVWHYDGANWAEYDAWDLTCGGTYASFTVTGFSGYAVVAALIPGDANGDNHVDETDAAALATYWGQSGDWKDGDFDGDGLVGPRDASILAANWGYGTEQSGESNSVPEPGALVTLLAMAALTLLWRGERKA